MKNMTKTLGGKAISLGFTLAEVLITLVVIGVVAALTIPAVVHKYQQMQFYTQFMKTYNTLQKVFQMTAGENGPVDVILSDDVTPNEFMEKYFVPYLQVSSVENLPDYTLKALDGSEIGPYSAAIAANAPYNSDKYYILNDGSAVVLAIFDPENNITILGIDTNGEKGPNVFGRDVFSFTIKDVSDSNGDRKFVLKPERETGVDNDACSVEGSGGKARLKGHGCADRLLKEGKMNY